MAATATVTPVAGEQDWGALVDEYETNIVTESLEKKVEQLDVNKNAPAAATAATAAPAVAAEEAPAAAPSDEQVLREFWGRFTLTKDSGTCFLLNCLAKIFWESSDILSKIRYVLAKIAKFAVFAEYGRRPVVYLGVWVYFEYYFWIHRLWRLVL